MRFPVLAGQIALASSAAMVAGLLTATPASGEEPTTISIPLSNISAPLSLNVTSADGEVQGYSITLPPMDSNQQVADQRLDLADASTALSGNLILNVGTVNPKDLPPLDPNVGESLAPLVKWSDEARGALNWMIPEGVEFVRTFHDVPSDERIERYGRPHLRTHMVDRLLEIMDKRITGQPLTKNERNALAFVEGQYLERDRLVAQAAYDEYRSFKASPCSYTPPPAPPFLAKPETMPKKVTDWCKLPKTQAVDAFDFAPPLPSPEKFTAWGAYKYADELGLTSFEDPVTLKNLTEMAVATATVGGFAAAGLGGAAAFKAVNALPTVSSFLGGKIFPHSAKLFFQFGSKAKGIAHFGTKLGTSVSSGSLGSVAGAVAAAVIAVAVIVFLVVTGVSIYLLVKHEEVGKTLRDRVDKTKKTTDPFGLTDLAEEYASKPIDYANPPAYRTAESHAHLSAQIARWSSEYHEDVPDFLLGTTISDPRVWADNATTASDMAWRVRVGDGVETERRSLSVPHEDGTATVRFSRGWMIVDPPSAQPYATTQFGYIDQFGVPRLVTRDPTSTRGFVVSDADGNAERRTTLTFLNEKGAIVRARLKRPAPTYLAGPRPAAVGPMFAGRPVMLRPNPVGTNGASLDDTVVQDDYTFDWTVEALDNATGQWGVVHSSTTFGTSFVPVEPGRYDARVTLTSVDDSNRQLHGSVRFEVTSPPLSAPVALLEDNGFDRLELDLQLLEQVPGDDISVRVTWPGKIGEETNPVQTLGLDCIQTGPIECTTPRTGLANALVFRTTPATDLRRPVRLVATNSTGGSYEAEFPLGNGRPVVVAPPVGSNAGEPGTVLVGQASTQVTLPLDPGAGVQNYVAGTLVPSPGGGQDFGLMDPTTGNTTGAILLPELFQGVAEVSEDPATGTWYLRLRGVPNTGDLGSFEVPLVVAQTNGTRQLVMIVVHIVASTKDRYRASVQTDVDPNNIGVDTLPEMYPMLLGGRVSDARYTGEMCASLEYRDFGDPARTYCAPLAKFYTADGVAKKLPVPRLFPTGLRSGSYRAEAWLNTPGARVDIAPLGTSFFLTQDVTYPAPTVALGKIGIKGKPLVGRTLRATVASVDPTGATLRYQWLRDGTRILRATQRSYEMKRVDRGNRLSVRVTASFPDWTKTVRTSPRTTIVR
jgi:hypothetical protein